MPSNYDTTPIDVSSILGAATQGQANAQSLNQNFLQHQVGATAATQGLLPASQAAFMGGDVQQGAALQSLSLQRQSQLYDLMGRAAVAADTPQKWNQVVDSLEGPGYNGPFRDFNSRDTVRMMAMSAQQQAQIGIQQQLANQAGIHTSLQPGGGVLAVNQTNPNNITAQMITPSYSTGVPGTSSTTAPSSGPQTGAQAAASYPPNRMLNTPMGAAEAQRETAAEVQRSDTSFTAAQQNNMKMAEMEDDLETIENAKGPLAKLLIPGAAGGARLQKAKDAQQIAISTGAPLPFTTEQIGAAERVLKLSTGMGFDLARTLGSKESTQIITQAVGLQPGLEMTPAGRRRIIAGLAAANQREIDYHGFLQDPANGWMQARPDTVGAQEAFNKTRPVSYYVSMAKRNASSTGRITSPEDAGAATPTGTAADPLGIR